ncbi:MAG: hypothetical protein QOG77_1945 [Solirubrobacteraceae bacterium]|nr:hypothetical protein [Solirubrobacteraceae bacterium]
MQRRQLESAVATYAHLRGLLLLPLGVLLVVAALANEEILPTWSFPAALIVAGLAALPILRHYREHYGSVRPSPRTRLRNGAAIAAAVVTMIATTVLLAGLPVNTLAVGFALAMLAGYAIGVGLATHHVVVWGALLIGGALPVWDGNDSGNAGLLMAGVAVAVAGILDHRAFLHTFGPPADAGA